MEISAIKHQAATHTSKGHSGKKVGNSHPGHKSTRHHSSTHLSAEAREHGHRRVGHRHLSALAHSFGSASSSSGAGQTRAEEGGQGASNSEVQQFLQQAAAAYGANPRVLSEIGRRESNFNTGDLANNWDSNARRGTPSRGMFQFIQPTFQSMAPRARAANPQAWAGVSNNWTDWRAQALTTAWAITHGQGRHWSTYRAAVASAGGSGRA